MYLQEVPEQEKMLLLHKSGQRLSSGKVMLRKGYGGKREQGECFCDTEKSAS